MEFRIFLNKCGFSFASNTSNCKGLIRLLKSLSCVCKASFWFSVFLFFKKKYTPTPEVKAAKQILKKRIEVIVISPIYDIYYGYNYACNIVCIFCHNISCHLILIQVVEIFGSCHVDISENLNLDHKSTIFSAYPLTRVCAKNSCLHLYIRIHLTEKKIICAILSDSILVFAQSDDRGVY